MLKLYDCTISRRGKGAKGTIKVKTLGIPFANTEGIAKDWSYADLGFNLQNFIANVRQTLGNMVDVTEAQLIVDMAKGIDMRLKSDNAKDQNESALLGNRLYTLGLATDKDEAIRIAKQILTFVRGVVESGYATYEQAIEDQIDKRRKIVADLKAKGSWSSNSPRLVDNRPQVVSQEEIISDENESDDDSDNES